MIVNLDKAALIVLSGSKVQLHFQDSSVHVRKFKNRTELSQILESWKTQTRTLRAGRAEAPPR